VNPRDLLYRSLDPAERRARRTPLSPHDDGELYLQHRVTEAFGFDDGRLKTADYHTDRASACAA
jgi:TldD protein